MTRLIRFSAAVLLGSLAASCTGDPETRKRRHLERGDQYAATGKPREALIEYVNALRINPGDGVARLRVADAFLDAGEVRRAFPEYIRAADQLPNDIGAQLKAANMLIRAGLFKDAQARLREVLKREPQNATALMLLGNALGGLTNVEDATAVLGKLLEIDPERAGAYTNIGVLGLAQGDVDQAEAAFRRAVEVSQRSPDSLIGLANFYRAVRRYDEAETLLKDVYAAHPKHIGVNDALASLYVETDRQAAAEPHLEALVQLTGLASARYALASHYVGVRRFDEAVRTLQPLVNEPARASEATTRIAMIQYMAGEREKALELVEHALKADPKHALVLTTKARLLLAADKPAEALPVGTAAVQANADLAVANLTVGRIHMALRNSEEARRAFTRVLQLEPRSLPALMELADLHYRRREMDTAVQFADQAASAHKGNLAARLILVRALIARSNTHERAEQELRDLAGRFPRSAAVYNALGALQLARKDHAAATKAFEHALTVDTNSFEAVSGLISLDMGAGRTAAARGRADAIVARHPSSVPQLLLAANIYSLTGGTSDAESLTKRALLADPGNPVAYTLLAQLYVEQSRTEEAVAAFEEVARLQPRSVGPPTMLGLLAYIKRDAATARQWWEKALAIDASAAAAANNLAWLYAESNSNLDTAVRLAEAARAKYPDLPQTNDTLGWAYHRKGESVRAIPLFQHCVELEPTNPVYQLHLGLAYAREGLDVKARSALERAPALDPGFSGAAEARRALKALVF